MHISAIYWASQKLGDAVVNYSVQTESKGGFYACVWRGSRSKTFSMENNQ